MGRTDNGGGGSGSGGPKENGVVQSTAEFHGVGRSCALAKCRANEGAIAKLIVPLKTNMHVRRYVRTHTAGPIAIILITVKKN